MHIDPKMKILDYEGEPLMQATIDGEEPMTLKTLIFMALNNPIPQEQWNAESRMRIFDICVKLTNAYNAATTVELDDGEPTFILDRADKLGNGYAPLWYARLEQVLKPDKKTEPEPEPSTNGNVAPAPV